MMCLVITTFPLPAKSDPVGFTFPEYVGIVSRMDKRGSGLSSCPDLRSCAKYFRVLFTGGRKMTHDEWLVWCIIYCNYGLCATPLWRR